MPAGCSSADSANCSPPEMIAPRAEATVEAFVDAGLVDSHFCLQIGAGRYSKEATATARTRTDRGSSRWIG